MTSVRQPQAYITLGLLSKLLYCPPMKKIQTFVPDPGLLKYQFDREAGLIFITLSPNVNRVQAEGASATFQFRYPQVQRQPRICGKMWGAGAGRV